MRDLKPSHIAAVTVTFLAVTIVCLWSWNTLAGLFDGPTAQYKHVVAATLLLAVLRLVTRHDRTRVRYHSDS